jgi:hypothetical protein
MRIASWVLLTIVGALILLGSVGSAVVAYRSGDQEIEQLKLKDVSLPEGTRTLLLARRGTAASFGAAFATLYLFTVLGPYRRGEKGAWWAILVSLIVLAAFSSARYFTLGTIFGAVPTLLALGIGTVALLLDVRRLKAAA